MPNFSKKKIAWPGDRHTDVAASGESKHRGQRWAIAKVLQHSASGKAFKCKARSWRTPASGRQTHAVLTRSSYTWKRRSDED